ncbi:signal peptidase II [Helicobacter mustelae]|uniref:signal peptidase II n=1 Tax=Helicobacter mustelae TaxID=217 RepID=UPI000E0E8403|nr:signal peptidase II [Helicobacter mustelae]
MRQFYWIFFLVFLLDQGIKLYFVQQCGGREFCMVWDSKMLSLMLVFNKGVAFSFLSMLGDWLKYLQIVFMLGIGIVLYLQRKFFFAYRIAFGLIFGAGSSNLLDRFTYGGVVDYVYWHYGFDFAVFNFADVMIDAGVVLLLFGFWRERKQNPNPKAP